VNLSPHSIAQGLVNALMTCDSGLAVKFCRNDGGKKVLAIALHHQVGAWQAIGNVLLHFSGCRVSHKGLAIENE